MSAFSNASPTERFKISEIAIKRMRKEKGSDQFEWAEFVAYREQVAQEKLRKLSMLERIVTALRQPIAR